MARKKSIQVRLDEKLKERAERVFATVGIDTPTAIRGFFTKVVEFGGIPFMLTSRKGRYGKNQLAAMDQMSKEIQ